MIIKDTLHFSSGDRKSQIHVNVWLPQANAKAVFQIAHGVDEHSARYDEFAVYMAENGYIVAAGDHIGHGKSAAAAEDLCSLDPEAGWDYYVKDLHTLYTMMRAQYAGLAYILFGHSMGSFIVRTFLIQYPDTLSAAILCGTAQKPTVLLNAGLLAAGLESLRLCSGGRSKLLDSLCFGSYNKQFSPNRTKFDWLTRDTEQVDLHISDPLCGNIPTVGLYRQMLRALKHIKKPSYIAEMQKDLPILLIAGQKDPVGENGKGPEKVRRSFLKAGCTDITMKFYPGARHELINEINRAQIYSDILEWCENKL